MLNGYANRPYVRRLPNHLRYGISLTFHYVICAENDKMVWQSGVAKMTKEQAYELGYYLRTRRESRKISARDLAAQVGIDAAQILRLEHGQVASPQATVLGRLAEHLRVPVNDLFVLAGYPTSRSLPTIGPYLHAKYPRLSSDDYRTVLSIIEGSGSAQPLTHPAQSREGKDEH